MTPRRALRESPESGWELAIGFVCFLVVLLALVAWAAVVS